MNDLFIQGLTIDWDRVRPYNYVRQIPAISGIDTFTLSVAPSVVLSSQGLIFAVCLLHCSVHGKVDPLTGLSIRHTAVNTSGCQLLVDGSDHLLRVLHDLHGQHEQIGTFAAGKLRCSFLRTLLFGSTSV